MIPVMQIKKDLAYSNNLADTIEVLKLIASSEFSNLSGKMEKTDPLLNQMIGCFQMLSSACRKSPFFSEKKNIPKAYLMICSDEGFLGELNAIVINAALSRGIKENAKFIVLGERGARTLKDAGLEYVAFPSVKNDIKMEDVVDLANYIMSLYSKNKISGFSVSYMKFISFTKHHLNVTKLLPCNEVAGFIKEKETDMFKTLIEPDPHSALEYLVKLWLKNNLYNIFWSSKLTEWAIRVMRLEHSSEELKEINKGLKLKYFKSVHSLNDKVIREIFAARTAA